MFKKHFEGHSFERETVRLDDSKFSDCTFVNCILEYAGTGPVSMVDCKFTDPRWEFVGPARNTLQFMRAIYHGLGDVGKQLVENTFESLKKP